MKIKYIAAISIFIFWAVITAVLAAGLVFYQERPRNGQTSGQQINGQTNGQTAGVSSAGNNKIILTSAEVAKHNIQSNCWVIIGGKIYDVTSLLSTHSGGTQEILKNCGKDATADFQTKEKNPAENHSSFAQTTLASYYIGDLGSAAASGAPKGTTVKNSPAGTSTATSTAPSQGTTQPPISTIALTSAEVAKHNNQSNCWFIVSGKVYDVTNFFGSHPGGNQELLSSCGTDATSAFQTRGGTGSHSQNAVSMLAGYFIGNLGANINTVPNPVIPQNIEDEDDEDD